MGNGHSIMSGLFCVDREVYKKFIFTSAPVYFYLLSLRCGREVTGMHFFAFVIFKVIFIVFFVALFVLLFRKGRFCRHHAADAINVLETRFVNGEITSDEYERIRNELTQSRKK